MRQTDERCHSVSVICQKHRDREVAELAFAFSIDFTSFLSVRAATVV